ncbi:hypothetical protein DL770_006878 [Monosporascus sp. CRB-9-2]|nr:hypothetical protein DL770_006878 [Monosporascus sp. CRB-9-2]
MGSQEVRPEGFYHENPENPGTTNVSHSYLLDEDYRVFDNAFFNVHPREAESMDPQQRILLEAVYECIDSAGYSMSGLRGSSTGIFVGQMSDDYRDMLMRDVENHSQYQGSGTSRAMTANRVSYFFDWKGPSMNIDTACSSSLVALYQAIQTLRSGESQMAVAAVWDADADGYARGEGFVVAEAIWNAFFPETAGATTTGFGNGEPGLVTGPSPRVAEKSQCEQLWIWGTNAHAIIESSDGRSARKPLQDTSPCGPLTISANSGNALRRAINSLSHALRDSEDISMADLSWTLQNRRTEFPFRASFSARDKRDLMEKLDAATSKEVQNGSQHPISTKAKKVLDVRILGIFTGQGAQWPGMGAYLYRESLSFRRTIDELEETLNGIPDGSVLVVS